MKIGIKKGMSRVRIPFLSVESVISSDGAER